VNLFLCSPGFENALCEEARAARVLWPGVVGSESADDFIFARQILPDVVGVPEPSIAKLADGALAFALPKLDRPFRIDALVSDEPADPNLGGELLRRVSLVKETLLERRRSLAKRQNDAGPLLFQLLLPERDRLYASVAEMGHWPVPFPGGRVPVADDWDAPSSAFRKLEEALAWLGQAPKKGERCVDLGAAPGGWSHVALKRGASVIAVDRADLDPRIAKRVQHVRRDGFSYVPDGPVDWLLCDIIAAPSKSLALLEQWLSKGWARNLVFHLKFKGRGEYALAQKARALDSRLRVKHLFHDRNEVTVMACGLLDSR
jgi:23S rRNA (cytidine2498-2'-O)-methyltransferase